MMLQTVELVSSGALYHPVIDGPCAGYVVQEWPANMEWQEYDAGRPLASWEITPGIYGEWMASDGTSLGMAVVLVYDTEEQAELAQAAQRVPRLWQLACNPCERARIAAAKESARQNVGKVIAYSA